MPVLLQQNNLRFLQTFKIFFLVIRTGYRHPFFPAKLRQEITLIYTAGLHEIRKFGFLIRFHFCLLICIYKNFRIQFYRHLIPIPEIIAQLNPDTICILESFCFFKIFAQAMSINPQSHCRILQHIIPIQPVYQLLSGNTCIPGSQHTDQKLDHLRRISIFQWNGFLPLGKTKTT